VFASGVAEYHFGQPEQALALLRRAEQDNDPLISGTAKLYHAMMLQKLNHSTEAADLLKEAEQRFAGRLQQPSDSAWWDILQTELALQDARELIRGNSK